MEKTAFELACERAGGLVALANSIGKAKQTVNHYKTRVPTDVCPLIELATGVTCEELRSDVKWIRVPDGAWPNGKPLVDVVDSLDDISIKPKPSEHASAKRGSDRPSNHREER